MKKLRCTSCGAELKVDEGNEFAVCEHCGSRYKLNEDLNINIKIDDNVKEVLNKSTETANKMSKFMLIPFVIFFIVFIGFFIFKSNFIKGFNEKSKNTNEENGKKQQEEIENSFLKEYFNVQFSNANGTKSGFLLESVLDTIIESNKTHDRKVTLIFDGNSTIEEDEILNYKHSLNDRTNYEVIVNYDNDGYINEIKVDKID